MTARTPAGTRRRAPGQALAEFALVLPVLLFALFGIIQAGLLLEADIALVNATRDAARAASTYRVAGTAATQNACGQVGTQLRRQLPAALPGYSSARLAGTAAYGPVSDPNGGAFTTVTIQAAYALPLLVPIVGPFLDRIDGAGAPAWAPPGDTLVLTATETMRVEGSSGDATVSCSL